MKYWFYSHDIWWVVNNLRKYEKLRFLSSQQSVLNYNALKSRKKKEFENLIPIKSNVVFKLFSKEHVHNKFSQNLSEQSIMNKSHHYSVLDKLKYELEYILRGQKHAIILSTKGKSLQRNSIIWSQSFFFKIKTFYYFQNIWTNLLITCWKKIIFITSSQGQVNWAKWGFIFSTSCSKKKIISTPIF